MTKRSVTAGTGLPRQAVFPIVLLILVLCFAPPARAGGLSVRGSLGVYSVSGENYLRASNGDPAGLNAGEYIAFYVDLTNTSGQTQRYFDPHFRVDGGEKLRLQDFSLENGQTTKGHIYHVNMAKIDPGRHLFEFYVSGSRVFSGTFDLLRDWRALMDCPTAAQKEAARGKGRSPYIVFYPQFGDVPGITEYTIDFQIDDMDNGTYFSTLDADLDISALTGRYASVTNDYNTPGGFYCGVQKWDDGRTGVIMSVWDNICRDKSGRETIVCADRVYPEFRAGTSRTSGEGRFQQFIREYPVLTRNPYRILLQLYPSKSSGNTELAMWICDLNTGKWEKLVVWDLGYRSPAIRTYDLGGFMENYLTQFAGSVRSVSFSNVRGRDSRTGRWTAAKKVMFTVNNSITRLEYRGSYNFGSDASAFWIVTSGAEGLCRLPKSGTVFTVKNVSADDPY